MFITVIIIIIILINWELNECEFEIAFSLFIAWLCPR